MKHTIRDVSLMLGQVDRHHVRLGLVVVNLILFVLGAGAPGMHGDVGGG